MEFYIKNSAKFIGKKVTIKGWIYNYRSSGSIVFLQIRDGTGFIQGTVIKNQVSPNVFRQAQKITLETSLEIEGDLKEEKRAPGGYEVTVTKINIFSIPSEEYPISKKDHGPDFLLNHRHLWLRSRRQWAIQRIRNVIIYAIYDFLNANDFIKIDAPILTPNACEGTTTLFPVPYLPAWEDKDIDTLTISLTDQKPSKPFAYLSQSGQLYLEAAIMAHRKVFDFGPTFRAEKSKTRRHLNEFWMMDAEAAFVEHTENIMLQEKLIVFVVKKVLEKCSQELTMLDRNIEQLKPACEGNYKIISHKDALEILRKNGINKGDNDDFGGEDETILSDSFDRPLFIERYPKEVKAFYMKEDPKNSQHVLNDDLLAPEGYGEIIGGSQREDDYDKLLSRIKTMGLNIDDLKWYLDLRKYGSVAHSGFGLGLERIVAWICKLDHVRETIPFPRMMERFKP